MKKPKIAAISIYGRSDGKRSAYEKYIYAAVNATKYVKSKIEPIILPAKDLITRFKKYKTPNAPPKDNAAIKTYA